LYIYIDILIVQQGFKCDKLSTVSITLTALFFIKFSNNAMLQSVNYNTLL